MINPQVVVNSIFYSTLNLLPWRRKWQPTPVLLPGKSHGWRSLLGDSPWGCKESDMTERLHSLHFYSAQLSASVQFSSVAQSCPTLCDPVNCSMPGLPVHHQLPEFTQTHCPSSRWCHPAISSCYPLLPPAPTPSQHQGLFQWVNSSHEVAKVLEFQLQHQSFQWTPRPDLL